AASPHPGATAQRGVERGAGGNRERGSRPAPRLHHPPRPDRQDLSDRPARRDQLLERIDHQPLAAVAAVVGGNEDLVADGPQFVLEDKQIPGACSQDGNDLIAGLVEGLCGWGGDGRAYSAPRYQPRTVTIVHSGPSYT